MTDLLIYERGEGGDLFLRGNDLAQIQGQENAPYLAMFGGADWWGNYTIPNKTFSSLTEQTLNTTPLNSAGRITIENAIKADLSYLNNIPGTTYTVTTTITAPNRLEIAININGKTFYYLWNPDTLFLTYKI